MLYKYSVTIIIITTFETVSKATLGELLRDGVECVHIGFSERIDLCHLELNLAELF